MEVLKVKMTLKILWFLAARSSEGANICYSLRRVIDILIKRYFISLYYFILTYYFTISIITKSHPQKPQIWLEVSFLERENIKDKKAHTRI